MGNLTLEDVNNMYLDVLKEIGNIGAGNATTAIANMLGMKIDMNVPNVKLMEVSKLGTAVGAEDETIVGIFLEVMNDIEGSMMFLVDIPSARYGKQFATLCERANIKCIKTGSSWCNHTEKRTADDACRAHIGVKIISFQQIKQ